MTETEISCRAFISVHKEGNASPIPASGKHFPFGVLNVICINVIIGVYLCILKGISVLSLIS